MLALKNSKRINISAPSNIAFIKYWGKYGRQLPINPSLSMTLDKCRTHFEVEYDLNGDECEVLLTFEGKRNNKFEERIKRYCDSVLDIAPELKHLRANIKSSNTFPHSAGIASSASAMACLGSLLSYVVKGDLDLTYGSMLARLASGSAGRSLYADYAIWGESQSFKGSSNEFAVGFTDFHKSFSHVCDSIVIINDQEKTVSSSAGHQLMESHPYKVGRVKQAFDNFNRLLVAMQEGDWDSFGKIIELEALSLHALMMSSDPSFILLAPKSLEFISELKNFREISQLPVYFTIDAGPNIHVIYPHSVKENVASFLNSYGERNKIEVIHDQMGEGPIIEIL